jgi:glyoxylase-like metal-dependent hydrolase (beta-lactamase superfamily II)
MPKIIDGVYSVPGQDEMIPDSHTYIVGEPSSHDLSLIDPGLTGKGHYKIESIKKMGIELTDIKRVIMTHTHFDHIGSLAEIKRKIPEAELWIHVLEADPLENGDERTVYGMEMFEQMCRMQYGTQPGAFTLQTGRKLKGGETLEIGEMQWEVIHVPGHSLGSIALYHRPKKILIPGDVIYADNAIGRFDLHGADGAELKKSLMRLAKLEVEVLLPGHNRVVTKLQSDYALQTLRQWEPYLA